MPAACSRTVRPLRCWQSRAIPIPARYWRRRRALTRRPRRSVMTDILLSTGNLSFAYPERTGLFRRALSREIVKRVDLAVPRGSVLGLVGESGSGKTTLGRLLVRLLKPTSGGIQFDGIEIGGLAEAAMRPLRARIQMIFQDPQSSAT